MGYLVAIVAEAHVAVVDAARGSAAREVARGAAGAISDRARRILARHTCGARCRSRASRVHVVSVGAAVDASKIRWK